MWHKKPSLRTFSVLINAAWKSLSNKSNNSGGKPMLFLNQSGSTGVVIHMAERWMYRVKFILPHWFLEDCFGLVFQYHEPKLWSLFWQQSQEKQKRLSLWKRNEDVVKENSSLSATALLNPYVDLNTGNTHHSPQSSQRPVHQKVPCGTNWTLLRLSLTWESILDFKSEPSKYIEKDNTFTVDSLIKVKKSYTYSEFKCYDIKLLLCICLD